MGNEFIKTREDFIVFLRNLSKDFKENSEHWENRSLGSFIEAMESWAEDMDGYYINTNNIINVDLENGEWRIFADILSAAKIYE